MKPYTKYVKPFVDFLSALILIAVLSPVIVLVIVLLFIANKGSVFFLQPRPGYKGKIFKIIKFKTMKDAFDDLGNPLPDELRITKVGQWVRSASVDEILQLFNVLKGDMSIIGPRPLLVQYLSRYSVEQARRHDVKPGITGWAQINGRNAISWQEKFNYDVQYVERISFLLDLKILVLTLIKVFNREGVNEDGHVTMQEFMGN